MKYTTTRTYFLKGKTIIHKNFLRTFWAHFYPMKNCAYPQEKVKNIVHVKADYIFLCVDFSSRIDLDFKFIAVLLCINYKPIRLI